MSEKIPVGNQKTISTASKVWDDIKKWTGNVFLTGVGETSSLFGSAFATVTTAFLGIAGGSALLLPSQLIVNGIEVTRKTAVAASLVGAGVSGVTSGLLLKGGHSIGRLARVDDAERILYNAIKIAEPLAWIVAAIVNAPGLALFASAGSAVSTFVRLRNRKKLAN